MSGEGTQLQGPDLEQGIALSDLADGAMLLGHAGGEAVLIARQGDELFAIGATCTHYGGPLAEGLMVGDTVHCPWHHACFSLRTGEALHAPALNPVPCWTVEQRDGKAFVTRKTERAPLASSPASTSRRSAAPSAIVIIGSGAAGSAAAEMLRRQGYDRCITMIDADPAAPYDRPNLSKDYLAGNAPEEWIPLRPPGFYEEHGIDIVRSRAKAIDLKGKRVTLDTGATHDFDRLLVATGADPVRLDMPGGELPHVHYLRTLADSRSIIARAQESKRAVVIGASFIGLEVAASLRARGLDVHVVAPEARPFERILGAEMGDFIKGLHEEHGVVFHLRHTAGSVRPGAVVLDDGTSLDADLVVIGVGVRPSVALAEQAGLAMDHGVVVDEYLETSAAGIFAAGDIARWPDRHSGERIRVEHWVVAQRQGQAAAWNLLGAREPFTAVPFFWSAHYDVTIAYVGHATTWDRIDVDGDIADRNCVLAYRAGGEEGKTLAVASIFRDQESLEAEVDMERNDWAALRALVPAANS
jgi:NADPH-dependent 2,4-dienoyl-CoA reductase/sulfur reductase-like enzyme/nitrite reductase/ring-hydroxylating ferredoxin subunit